MDNQNVYTNLRETAAKVLPPGSSLYLYGSRARGDYHEDSDWDLLILLNKSDIEQSDYDYVYEFSKAGAMMNEVLIPIIYTRDQWEQRKGTDFYRNVEDDKIIIL